MSDFLPEMEPDGDYFQCSDRQEHSETCHEIDDLHPAREFGYERIYTREGNEFGCITLTKWDVAINNERKKWRKSNLDPNQVAFPPIEMKAQINTLVEVIAERMIDDKELDLMYQQHLLLLLKQAREDLEPAVQQIRRQQLRPGLLGPDGKPLGGQN